jgi:hypothetical protein
VDVLEFLQTLFKQGLGYSVLNTAQSALSSVILLPTGEQFGVHIDVKMFMRGIFNSNPPRPRYVTTWDLVQVLDFSATWTAARISS